MIISATFSKPIKNIQEVLGRDYLRCKVRASNIQGNASYIVEYFTQKQTFHETLTDLELDKFIEEKAGHIFKNAVIRTEDEEITILSNKKGEITRLNRKLKQSTALKIIGNNRKKSYLINEGDKVPFMILLGITNSEGKVISSKYDKFKQINRYLEFIDDVLPELKSIQDRPIRIADFGCGKSYLTFAVHYYLTEVRKIPCDIIGLDLKEDVINYCNKITEELHLEGLHFDTGDIASYSYNHEPDMVITLHACDTATDYALDYAVKHNCKVILSVPCCQHEINGQLNDNMKSWGKKIPESFEPLLKYGLIKEKFASLLTDALRGEILERQGYSVQMLEFIDIEHTPKNILIRAVKKTNANTEKYDKMNITELLKLSPKLENLLK